MVALAPLRDDAAILEPVEDDAELLLGLHDVVPWALSRRKVPTDHPPATKRPGGDDQTGSDQNDVLEHVLTLERRRVMRPREQASGQQEDRREDPDELDRPEPDRQAPPSV